MTGAKRELILVLGSSWNWKVIEDLLRIYRRSRIGWLVLQSIPIRYEGLHQSLCSKLFSWWLPGSLVTLSSTSPNLLDYTGYVGGNPNNCGCPMTFVLLIIAHWSRCEGQPDWIWSKTWVTWGQKSTTLWLCLEKYSCLEFKY